jgi:hypothetical protein
MSPNEARQDHEARLLNIAKSELGIRHDVRVFESAEGSRAPLTIADSEAAAKQLSEARTRFGGGSGSAER